MFGSMPMKVAGNTVKIHYVRSATLSISTVVYLHMYVVYKDDTGYSVIKTFNFYYMRSCPTHFT